MTRSRWAIVALVSLGLNLFALGFFVSRGLREQTRPMERAPFGLHQLLRSTENSALRTTLRAQLDALRPQRQALRATRRAVREALEAEPFDSERARKALEELRAKRLSLEAQMHKLLVETASQLSVGDRKRLTEHNWRRRGQGPAQR